MIVQKLIEQYSSTPEQGDEFLGTILTDQNIPEILRLKAWACLATDWPKQATAASLLIRGFEQCVTSDGVADVWTTILDELWPQYPKNGAKAKLDAAAARVTDVRTELRAAVDAQGPRISRDEMLDQIHDAISDMDDARLLSLMIALNVLARKVQ